MEIKRMRDLREDHDKTQQEIAELLNMHRSVYRRYESGERETPSWVIVKLAQYYREMCIRDSSTAAAAVAVVPAAAAVSTAAAAEEDQNDDQDQPHAGAVIVVAHLRFTSLVMLCLILCGKDVYKRQEWRSEHPGLRGQASPVP